MFLLTRPQSTCQTYAPTSSGSKHIHKHNLKSRKSQQHHDQLCPWRSPPYYLWLHLALSAAPRKLWHQHDLLLGPQSTRQILGLSVSEVPTMSLPSSSRPMPEGSPPNLPDLLPSGTLPEAVSLLHLPEELELLSESMVESMIMESLNPPAFYTFLTPDEDGECHGQEVKPCGG
ncbi:hypothetical protein GH733_019521, partial [Mirounga leonina]